jgi:ribonuclease HI
MALRSVIESFRALSRKGTRLRVRFSTDSRYIVDGMTHWVHDWARRGWKRKTGSVENLPLWQEAVEACAPHEIHWCWVRGHAGHAQNEYANHLAIRAASTLTASDGLVPSAFEQWIGDVPRTNPAMTLEPFPEEAAFKASGRLPRSSAASPSAGHPGTGDDHI